MYITLKWEKKLDGHSCTEDWFYFSLGDVLELSTFGVLCCQVVALLEDAFCLKSLPGGCVLLRLCAARAKNSTMEDVWM